MKSVGRVFVIGDIHGAYKALLQCLERSSFNKEKDTLISLGDIADGWPQVPECVEELLTIKNLIAIRGNHDVWCWNWFTLGHTPLLWIQQGGGATIDAYTESISLAGGLLTKLRHKAFWDNQIDYYIDKENRLFVHGGFSLGHGFEWSKTASVNILNATELHWNRDLAEFNTKSWGNYGAKYLDEFLEIYIGHTAHATTRFNFPEKKNIWNVDTGAGWSGKLTIMDVNTKEYWQSDSVKQLYPEVSGR